jgi:putative oxidoreductase
MRSANMEAAAALAGRFLFAALFPHEALAKLAGYAGALAYMQAFGVPGQLLPFAIAAELGGGLVDPARLSDPLGGAGARRLLHATAVLFHTKLGDRNQLLHFEKDLAIAGGFLVLFARGGGAWALDALRANHSVVIPGAELTGSRLRRAPE